MPEAANEPDKGPRQDRQGKHLLGFHADKSTFKAVKILAVKELKTVDAIMNQAVALVLDKHKQPVPPACRRKLKQSGLKID